MPPKTVSKERKGKKSEGKKVKTLPRKQGKRPAEEGEKNGLKRKREKTCQKIGARQRRGCSGR